MALTLTNFYPPRLLADIDTLLHKLPAMPSAKPRERCQMTNRATADILDLGDWIPLRRDWSSCRAEASCEGGSCRAEASCEGGWILGCLSPPLPLLPHVQISIPCALCVLLRQKNLRARVAPTCPADLSCHSF